MVDPLIDRSRHSQQDIRTGREEDLFVRVDAAISELRVSGKRVTFKGISLLTNCSYNKLNYYPKVKLLLDQQVERVQYLAPEQRVARNSTLLAQVQEAIIGLRKDGQPVTKIAVSKVVGRSLATMQRSPEIQALFSEQRCSNETALFEKVEEVMDELRKQGKKATCNAIAEFIGKRASVLMRNPQIRLLLEQESDKSDYHTSSRQARVDALLIDVQAAAAGLRNLGKQVTRTAICTHIGRSDRFFRHYPELREVLEQLVNLSVEKRAIVNYRQQKEERLFIQVQVAISEIQSRGESVTQTAICRALGCSYETLTSYPLIKAFLDQKVETVRRTYPERRQAYEDALFARMQAAANELRDQGESVTLTTIADLIEMSIGNLYHYPQLRERMESLIDTSAQNKHALRQSREDELLRQVQATIGSLRERNEPVTLTNICRMLGVNLNKFRRYPQIRAFLEKEVETIGRRSQEQRQLREEHLASQVEEAIAELRIQGKPVTRVAISLLVGCTPGTMQRYTQVKLLLDREVETPRGRYRVHHHEDDSNLLSQVQTAISDLHMRGELVTQQAICKIVGRPANALKRVPLVNELLQREAKKSRPWVKEQSQKREEDLLARAQAAVGELLKRGEPLTWPAISRIIGRSKACMERYASAKSFIISACRDDRIVRTQANAEKLVTEADTAIEQLKSRGEPVTWESIALLVGKNPSTLKKNLKIRVLKASE